MTIDFKRLVFAIPFLSPKLGQCSFRKGGMGEAGCTDLLSFPELCTFL